jgi:serine/threonine-protein kinase
VADPLPPSQRSISHYEILAPLGHGGMGEVYVAFDTTLQRKVALKAVRRDRLDDEARARLLREARILSQLDHPGICRVYDYVSDGGSDYLVLELIEGKTLRDAMAPLDAAAKLRIAEQIAQALTVAHAAGIVHRDLKPDNVMLLPDPSTGSGQGVSAKVLDFGLARSFDAPLPPGAGAGVRMPPSIGSQFDSAGETLPGATSGLADTGVQTVHGILLGTPAYMSPEQASGEPATAPSDMYAFGLLLQELFTGVPPYDFKTDLPTLLDQVRRGAAREATGVPRDLAALIADLKSVAPSRRPTAVEAARRLRRIREKPARRLRNALATAIVVVAIAGAVKYTVDLRRERTAAVFAREDADRRRGQAESLIGFMLGDLRPKLEGVGRLDLMDSVGKEAMKYFAAVPAHALSDEEVLRRSQAIYQVGQVSMARGDLKAGAARFAESLDLAAALAARDPQRAEWQVALAASHFYVADALRLQGDFNGAMRHFTVYRDIGSQLVARDPTNRDWLLELSYGYGNVAAVLEATGQYEAARVELERGLEISRRLVALEPDRPEFEDSLGNDHNRLAVVLEKLGEGQAALEHHRHSFAIRARLWERNPKDSAAERRVGIAASWLSSLYRDHGDLAKAWQYERIRSPIFERLAARDPMNADWQRELAVGQLRTAKLHRLSGEPAAALIRVQRAVDILRPLADRDASHLRRQQDAVTADVDHGAMLLASGRAAAAEQTATVAALALERLIPRAPNDVDLLRLLAEARLTAAAAMSRRGAIVESRAHLEHARAWLEDRAGGIKERRFLNVWAQVLRGLGRNREAEAIVARLRASGFRPFTP